MRRRNFTVLRSSILILLMGLMVFPLASRALADEAPAAPAAAPCELEKPTVAAYVDFLNQYIWRGYALSDTKGMVIQPSVTLSWIGFSANVWGNFDTFDRNPAGFLISPRAAHDANWNETDLTLSYSHDLFCGLGATVGVIYYALDIVPDSTEVYGGLTYSLPWFSLAFTTYREIAHYPGYWFQFDITRNVKLPCYGMNLDLGATFLYQDSEDKGAYPDPHNPFNDSYSAWHSAILSAALNIPFCKYFTLSPKIGFSTPLTDEARDEIKYLSWDGHADHVFGGIRLSASF